MFHFFCKKFSERCFGRGFLFPVYLVLSCLLVISLVAQEQKSSDLAGPGEPTKTDAGVPIEADTGEPAEAVSEEPAGADTSEPAKSVSEEPTGADTGEPAEAVSEEPAGADTGEPAKAVSEEPAGADTGEPAKAVSEEPAGADTGEPAKAVSEEPAGADTSEPAKAVSEEPAGADTSEPAKAVSEEPAGADTSEPAKAVSSEVQEHPHDTTPIRAGVQPGVSSFYSDGNITYARSNTKIKLSSIERISAVKQIQYKVDHSAYQAYVSPISIEEEGQHQISYRALDIVGNVEFESLVTVIIDDTPPVISVASNVSFIKARGDIYVPGNKNPQLYIRANDFYSGVKAIQYYVSSASEANEEKGDENFSDYSSGISLEAPGEKLIVYRAIDNLGNISEPKKMKIITDAAPPSIQINFTKKLILHKDKKYSVKNNKLILSADDEASGVASIYVKLSADEGFQPYVEPISMADDGEYNIEAKSIDRVGNESQIISESIIVDAEPPQTTLEFLSDVNEGSSSEPVAAPDDAEETTEDTEDTEKPGSEEEAKTNVKEESATVEETDTSEESKEKEEAATEE